MSKQTHNWLCIIQPDESIAQAWLPVVKAMPFDYAASELLAGRQAVVYASQANLTLLVSRFWSAESA